MSISQAVVQQAYVYRQQTPVPTYKQLAITLLSDVSQAAALRTAVQEYSNRQQRALEVPKDLPPTLPVQYTHECESVLNFGNDPALVIGDVHAPHTNIALLSKAIAVAKSRRVSTIICNGDFIDAASVSSYKTSGDTPLSLDVAYAAQTAKHFAQTFSRRGYLQGNHDKWATDYYGIDFVTFIRAFDRKAIVTNYSYAFYGDDIIIGHLDKYNSTPGYLAQQIGEKYKRHCLVSHDHIRGSYRALRQQQTQEQYSPYVGVSIGAMLQVGNFQYKKAAFNDLPAWQCGFALIFPQAIELYDDEGTCYETINRNAKTN